jgi:cell wall-associated NlpC family hydrolase
MQYLGTPYVWGGAGPGGFDCSGLIEYVYGQMGVSLPHNAAAQYGYGTPVSESELQPGDLLFFATVADGPSHVAIAIGGDQHVEVHEASELGRARLGHHTIRCRMRPTPSIHVSSVSPAWR